MIERKHRRPIGFYERQFVVRNIGNFYTSFNVTGKYRGTRRITPNVLSRALKKLIRDSNYWLVYNFYRTHSYKSDKEYDGTNFEVRPLESLNYNDAVKCMSVQSFDNSVLKMFNDLRPEMNSPTLALWMVYLIESSSDKRQYVSLVCDHALLDGVSGSKFHKDLMEALNLQDEYCEMQQTLFSYEDEKDYLGDSLIGPVEQLTGLFQPNFSTIIGHFASTFKDMLTYKWTNSPVSESVFAHNVITKEMTTDYQIVNFAPSELSKMLEFCRRNKITLTPFIHIIALKLLEKRFLPSQFQDIYGCLVSLINIFKPSQLLLNSDDEWLSLMKDFHQEIIDDLSSLDSFKEKGLVKYTNVWNSQEAKIGKREGRQTLLTSNIGMLKLPKPTCFGFTLEDVIFSSSTCGRYHFILDVAASEIGGLNVVFAYLPEYSKIVYPDGTRAMDNLIAEFKSRCSTIK
ncbi:uncharacterized protein KQ657_003127 [Scheffersomyces spartinae]|uniref:Alcohol acetyltransferase n=1 Tax=Scheffersomyces spartinae TaxID=45513 RepID=A0A9P7V4Z7_9ASCO|nr:uncharacterized protein KQ657_003127 [Scheffersomyces spartinae]KAG7191451.1 hypothetical protein KQ657_003127 [Scheffersomyces spartinae]